MPLVRIDTANTISDANRYEIAKIVHEAMVKTLNVPADDKFQVLTSLPTAEIIADPQYLGITRTDAAIFIQVTLNSGRTVEMKQAFYAAIADGIATQLHLRKEDVLINLIEVSKENWSFGNGQAQYA